jgi:hypothetical protein
MIVDLSPGDVIHIEAAFTLTVLAVEGDLIRFGLEPPEGKRLDPGEVGKDSEAADLKQRRKGWEWN